MDRGYSPNNGEYPIQLGTPTKDNNGEWSAPMAIVGGGGGGGGGPVTVADGADVTQGSKADSAATDNTSSWTVVALLKGILGKLLGSIAVTGTFWQTTQPVSGTFWQATQPVSGTVGVSSLPALPAGTNVIGHVIIDSAGNVSITSLPSLPTGTNSIGQVTANQGGSWTEAPIAATTGGTTPSHTISAASTNATSLKGSAGQVYGISISNTNAAARYFKLFNKASAPTLGTDVPKLTIQVPANGTVIRAFPVGLTLGTGIAWAATGAMADADATAIGAGDLSIDIDYL